MPPPTILIVEDHPMVRELLAYRLSKAYAVETVPDGQEAFDHLQQARTDGALPDLILSDIEMPRLNGIGLRRALLDDRDLRAIPFLFLTANIDKYIPHLKGLARVAGCIAKPFVMRNVLAQIHQAIRPAHDERPLTQHGANPDASGPGRPLGPGESEGPQHPAGSNKPRSSRGEKGNE